MSWSCNAQKVPADEVVVTIASFALGTDYSADFARNEAEQQLDAAKTAAIALFLSGAYGRDGEFNILINGHAEPGHERRPGYSGDYISVTITRWYDYTHGN